MKRYGGRVETPPLGTQGTSMACDCGARPEEIAAGIHYEGCASHDGPPDDPYDHYGQ